MARFKLSETRIRTLDKPGIYGDGDGLWLRVQKSGSRNWIFIWKRMGRRTELGLGGYGRGTAPVSLKLAREMADEIRDRLARGEDPRSKKRRSGVITFEKCMNDLLASKSGEWRNDKHRAQWEMTLKNYAKPLHDMPVAEIAMGDVKDVLLKHWDARPETASRLRGRIEAVIDYAIAHEWRKTANPARWKGLLDKVLPAPQKLMRGHHAALDYKFMQETIARLRQSKGVAARAVEFTVLTSSRTGEVRGAVNSEFDLDAAIWTVPAGRMKSGKEHRVPLCDRGIEIVREMSARATGNLIFGGGRDGSPVSATAMTKALRLAAPDKAATLHGLRSTFRDWAGEETEYTREIAELALAHQVGNEVERAYRRGDALEKRRALMCDWGAFCNG